jgi:hypothetical protein
MSSQGKLKERIEASDEQIDWLARSKILEILGEVKATFPEYPTAEEALTEMGVTGTPSKAVINELQTVANLKRIFTWFREWFGEP